jgi:hypothetical protein
MRLFGGNKFLCRVMRSQTCRPGDRLQLACLSAIAHSTHATSSIASGGLPRAFNTVKG